MGILITPERKECWSHVNTGLWSHLTVGVGDGSIRMLVIPRHRTVVTKCKCVVTHEHQGIGLLVMPGYKTVGHI